MRIDDAQRDLRRAYVGGGPGVFVSGLVWIAAALVAARQGVGTGFAALFFGGWLIYPASALVCRFAFRRAKEAADNPFGRVALESTIAMIGGLFAAWLFLPSRPDWVFPLSAIAVGTHYAVFRTTYGDMLFYALGAAITALGLAAIFRTVPLPADMPVLVGAIEIGFAILLIARAVRRPEG